MKAIYTDAATRELESFQSRQKDMLESVIAERKLVLGDEVLEITASDIKSASELIQIYRPSFRRTQSTELVTRAYIVTGILMMVGSFFYSKILEIYSSNRTQAMIFLMGAAMAAIGWLFSFWMQTRRRRMIEEAQAYLAVMGRKSLDIKESRTNDVPDA
jgi:predicted phage tail protein